MEERFPKRKHPVHYPAFDRAQAPVVHFVTVCTKDRRPLLASAEVHDAIVTAWTTADAFKVGAYVILPDHVHLFCAPSRIREGYLEAWVRYWKSLATRKLKSVREGQLWQRDFWDCQLRREDSYDEKWEDVRSNPVRHGLVKYATEWPYQGKSMYSSGDMAGGRAGARPSKLNATMTVMTKLREFFPFRADGV